MEAQPFPLVPGTFSTPAVSEIPGTTATVPTGTAIIEAMSLNLNPPYEVKNTPTGKVPVFYGTDVEIHDFIDWIFTKRKTAGEFIDRNPGMTRQHIRDYLLSALPDRFLGYGEKRDWVPNHEPTI